MTESQKLKSWLFEPPTEPGTVFSIIAWWEARRFFYNMIVGCVGICSFIVFIICIINSNALKPGEDAVEPMVLLFAWIPINICYTAGWIIEVLAFKTGFGRKRLLGPKLMQVGVGFSLFCVLLPSVVWGSVLIISGIKHVAHIIH